MQLQTARGKYYQQLTLHASPNSVLLSTQNFMWVESHALTFSPWANGPSPISAQSRSSWCRSQRKSWSLTISTSSQARDCFQSVHLTRWACSTSIQFTKQPVSSKIFAVAIQSNWGIQIMQTKSLLSPLMKGYALWRSLRISKWNKWLNIISVISPFSASSL